MVTFDELDAKDQELISYLSSNSRLSNQQIAKRTALSKDIVAYRLKRFREKKIVTRFVAHIDFSALGFLSIRTFIKLQNTTPITEKRIIQSIKSFPGVRIMGRLEGAWNYGWVAIARNPYEFAKVWDDFLKEQGRYVQDKDVNVLIEQRTYKMYASPSEHNVQKGICEQAVRQEYDNIDLDILEQLILDARVSLVRLSELTRLTPRTVYQRIKRMEDCKIIVWYTSIMSLGDTCYKVMINLEDINDMPLVYAFAQKNHRHVANIFRALGGADVEVDIFAQSFEKFLGLIDDLKKSLPKSIKNYSYHTISRLEWPSVRPVFAAFREK